MERSRRLRVPVDTKCALGLVAGCIYPSFLAGIAFLHLSPSRSLWLDLISIVSFSTLCIMRRSRAPSTYLYCVPVPAAIAVLLLLLLVLVVLMLMLMPLSAQHTYTYTTHSNTSFIELCLLAYAVEEQHYIHTIYCTMCTTGLKQG